KAMAPPNEMKHIARSPATLRPSRSRLTASCSRRPRPEVEAPVCAVPAPVETPVTGPIGSIDSAARPVHGSVYSSLTGGMDSSGGGSSSGSSGSGRVDDIPGGRLDGTGRSGGRLDG